jgi:hypothetical protein
VQGRYTELRSFFIKFRLQKINITLIFLTIYALASNIDHVMHEMVTNNAPVDFTFMGHETILSLNKINKENWRQKSILYYKVLYSQHIP